MKKATIFSITILIFIVMLCSASAFTENIYRFIMRYNTAAKGVTNEITDLPPPAHEVKKDEVYTTKLNEYVSIMIGLEEGSHTINGVVLIATPDGTRESGTSMIYAVGAAMVGYGFINSMDEMIPFMNSVGLDQPSAFDGNRHSYIVDGHQLWYEKSILGIHFVFQKSN